MVRLAMGRVNRGRTVRGSVTLSQPMEGLIMKKSLTLLAAAASATLAAAPTSAATVLVVTNSSPAVCTGADPTCNFLLTGEVDVTGAFTVTSNRFFLPTTGVFGATATNTATGTTNIDFTGATLTNVTTSTSYSGTVRNGFFDFAFSGPDNVGPGFFTLTLAGLATTDTSLPPSNPSIGGTASFSAAVVPEPATWALFILGFGAIGGALRRRSGAVRVNKAKLHFA